MFSSNHLKWLLLISACLLVTSSCRFWQGAIDNSEPGSSPNEAQQKVPFPTKEPEVFQTEIFVTSYLGGEKIERKYFVAKKGGKVLATFGVNEENSVSTLSLSAKEKYTIRHKSKAIEKKTIVQANADARPRENWREFLTTKLINEKRGANFESLGVEEGLDKYRVKIDGSADTEIYVFVDKEIGLPVLQEFYSVEGDKKTITQTIELKNFKTEVPDDLFRLPENYKRNWDDR